MGATGALGLRTVTTTVSAAPPTSWSRKRP